MPHNPTTTLIRDPRPSPADEGRDPHDPILLDWWRTLDDTYLDGRLREHVPDELLYHRMVVPGAVGEFSIRADGTLSVILDRRLILGTHPDLLPGTLPPAGLHRLIQDVLLHEQIHVACHHAGHPWGRADHTDAFAEHAAQLNTKMGLPPPRAENLPHWPHLDRDPQHYLTP